MNREKIEGVFALDKPLHMSSQRAVQIVKYWARRKSGNKKIKVGHAGTLDPLATGVLVVAVGREYTKTLDTVVAAQKEYVARIHLGYTSTTDDAEGQKKVGNIHKVPSHTSIMEVIAQFIGDVVQTPPVYSAIKVAGQEAYKRTRRGEQIEMASRKVHIDAIDVIAYEFPFLTIHVTCGKGTYIRSLARDIGDVLGTGAYLAGLERTRVGNFNLVGARDIQEFYLRIAVHASEIDHKRIDGTRVYVHEILSRIGGLASDDTFLLYHQSTFNTCLAPPKRSNYRIKTISKVPLWTQTRFSLDILREKPDVLWMPLHNVPCIRPKNTKVVVTIHDLAFKVFPKTFPWFDRCKLNFLTTCAVKKSDHIIAVSHSTKNDLLMYFPYIKEDKITVVHHGIDIACWQKDDDLVHVQKILHLYHVDACEYLIHVGAIQPRKNLILLIDAFVIIKKDYPHLKLVLAGGRGWLWQGIEKHARRCACADDIIFTGNISFDHMRILLCNARIFVFPSLYEGFGLPGLEAMAAGVPVVAAENSSIAEVLGDAAEYFDAHDYGLCVRQILLVLNNKNLRDDMIEKGLRRAQKFTWDACAKKTLAVLRR